MVAKRLGGAVLAALLVVPAACSGGGGSSALDEAPERVVTIGVEVPLAAGLTEFGLGIRNSVQLAVDQADAAGLIPGWTKIGRAHV